MCPRSGSPSNVYALLSTLMVPDKQQLVPDDGPPGLFDDPQDALLPQVLRNRMRFNMRFAPQQPPQHIIPNWFLTLTLANYGVIAMIIMTALCYFFPVARAVLSFMYLCMLLITEPGLPTRTSKIVFAALLFSFVTTLPGVLAVPSCTAINLSDDEFVGFHCPLRLDPPPTTLSLDIYRPDFHITHDALPRAPHDVWEKLSDLPTLTYPFLVLLILSAIFPFQTDIDRIYKLVRDRKIATLKAFFAGRNYKQKMSPSRIRFAFKVLFPSLFIPLMFFWSPLIILPIILYAMAWNFDAMNWLPFLKFKRRQTVFGTGYELPELANQMVKLALLMAVFWRLRDDKVGMIALASVVAHDLGATQYIIAHLTAAVGHLIKQPIMPEVVPPSHRDEHGHRTYVMMGDTANKVALGLTLATILVVLSGVIFKLSDNQILTLTVTPRLKAIAQSVRDMDTLHSKAWPIIVETINAVSYRIYGDLLIPGKHGAVLEQRDRWLKDIVPFLSNPRSAYSSRDGAETAIKLFHDGTDLAGALADAGVPVGVINHIYFQLRRLSVHLPSAEALLLGGTRIPAIGVMVTGAPAAGKTHFALPLATAYMAALGRSYDPATDSAVHSTTEEFENTYIAQPFLTVYDVFQVKDNAVRLNESSFIFANCDSDAQFAPKAVAEEKGRYPYVNEICYMTTNKMPLNFIQSAKDFLESPSALQRRIPFFLRLSKNRNESSTKDIYDDIEMWVWDRECFVRITFEQLIQSIILRRQHLVAAHSKYMADTTIVPISASLTPITSISGIHDTMVASQKSLQDAVDAQLGFSTLQTIGSLPKGDPPGHLKSNLPDVLQAPSLIAVPEILQIPESSDSEEEPLTAPNIAPRRVYIQKMQRSVPRDEPVIVTNPPPKPRWLSYEPYFTAQKDLEVYIKGPGAHTRLFFHPLQAYNYRDIQKEWDHIIARHPLRTAQQPFTVWMNFRLTAGTWGDLTNVITRLDGTPRNPHVLRDLADYMTIMSRLSVAHFNGEFIVNATSAARILALLEGDDSDANILTHMSADLLTARRIPPSHPSILKYPLLWAIVGTVGALTTAGVLYNLFAPAIKGAYEQKYRDDGKAGVSHKPTRLRQAVVLAQAASAKKPVAYEQKANSFHTSTIVKSVDANAVDLARSFADKGLATMFLDDMTIQVTMLTGRLGITCAHFFDREIAPDALCVLLRVGNGEASNCLWEQITMTIVGEPLPVVDGKETTIIRQGSVLLEFPAEVHPFRNFTMHLNDVELAPILPTSRAIVPRIDDTLKGIDTVNFSAFGEGPRGQSMDGKWYGLSEYYCIESSMMAGQCGTPVFIANPNVKHKLIGILEGDSGDGTVFIIPIPLAAIKAKLAGQQAPDAIISTHSGEYKQMMLVLGKHEHPIPRNWSAMGQTSAPYVCSIYSKCNLVRTPFNDWSCPYHKEPWQCRAQRCTTPLPPLYPPPFSPYVDADGVRRDPVAESCAKAIPLPSRSFTLAGMTRSQLTNIVALKYWPFFCPAPLFGVPPLLTFDQALNGVYDSVGLNLVRPLEPTTALGLPYANLPGWRPGPGETYKGKARFLHCTVHENFANCTPGCSAPMKAHPQIHEDVEIILAALKLGPINIINQRSNKVELRGPDKGPRTLRVLSMAINAVSRMLYSGLDSGMVANADVSYSCIGLNPHSLQYSNFYRKMQSFSQRFLGGDKKDADDRFPTFLWEACDLMDKEAMRTFGRLSPSEFATWATMTTNLCLSLSMSLLTVGSFVYETFNSMVTGYIRTLNFNTKGHTLANIVSWVVHRIENNLPWSPEAFHSENRLRSVGDDFTWGQALLNDTFNNHVLSENLQRVFGMQLTDPNKRLEMPPHYNHMNEVDFLARTPVLSPSGEYHGCLLESRMFKTLLYSKSNDPVDIEAMCRSVLLEVYHKCDPVLFNHWRDRFGVQMIRMKRPVSFPTYQELDTAYHLGHLAEVYLSIEDDSELEVPQWRPYTMKSAPAEGPSTGTKVAFDDLTVKATTENSSLALQVAPSLTPSSMDTLDVVNGAFGGTGVFRAPTVSDRRVKLGYYTWTSAMVQGDPICSHSLPSVMFSGSDLYSDNFKGYRYWHGRVRLEYSLVNVSTSSGVLKLVWFQGRAAPSANVFRISSERNWDISNNFPTRFIDIGPINKSVWDRVSTVYNLFGTAVVGVLHPLTGSNGSVTADAATLEVYAHFTELEFCGPDGVSVLPASEEKSRVQKIAQKFRDYEQKSDKNWRQVDPSNNPDVSAHVRERTKDREKKEHPKVQKVNKAPKPTFEKPSKEAIAKASTGSVLTSNRITDQSVPGIVANFLLGAFEAVGNTISRALPFAGDLIKGVPALLSMMDMPLGESPMVEMMAATRSWSHTTGVVDAKYISAEIKPYVSSPLLCAPDVHDLIQTPFLCGTYSYTSGSTVPSTIATKPIHPVGIASRSSTGTYVYTYNFNHLTYWAGYYMASEGSMLVGLVVESPVGTVHTLTITFTPGDAGFPALDQYGDVARLSWTIRTSGAILLEIPFTNMHGMVYNGPWDQLSAVEPDESEFSFLGGRMTVSLTTKLTRSNTTAAATAFLSIYAAASPNFRFKGYQGGFHPICLGTISVSLPLYGQWIEQARTDGLTEQLAEYLRRIPKDDFRYLEACEVLKMPLQHRVRPYKNYIMKADVGEIFKGKITPMTSTAQGTITENLRTGPTLTNVISMLKQPRWLTRWSGNANGRPMGMMSTPHLAILNLFQYYQGSLLVRFVFNGDISVAKPIYISHSPFVYGAITNTVSIQDITNRGNYELWDPRIRPEFTFGLHVNSCLFMSNNNGDNTLEKSAFSVHCENWTGVSIEVFTSVGEDFEVGHARSAADIVLTSTNPPMPSPALPSISPSLILGQTGQ